MSKPAKRETCDWRVDGDGCWDTECGGKWILTEGTPTDNEMRYCPRCGARLKVVRAGR